MHIPYSAGSHESQSRFRLGSGVATLRRPVATPGLARPTCKGASRQEPTSMKKVWPLHYLRNFGEEKSG